MCTRTQKLVFEGGTEMCTRTHNRRTDGITGMCTGTQKVCSTNEYGGEGNTGGMLQ